MAQYRGQAREGNFNQNHIKVPDQVDKLKAEGQRQLRNLESTKAFNAKQQSVFDQAEDRANQLEIENQKAVGDQVIRNLDAEQSAAERAWEVQTLNNELEMKEAQSAVKQAFDFTQAVTGVTKAYTDIVKINKNNQLKAINEVQFKNGYSVDDIRNAASVDANISNSEWQRTQIVQDYIREGKSQEFINSMYEHLVKGGGYRNYVTNVGVLTEQAAVDVLAQREILNNKDLPPEETRDRIAQLRTQQRSKLTVNGQIAGSQILKKGYDATIRRFDRTVEETLNRRINGITDQENEIDQNTLIRNALKGGDTEGWNIEAAMKMTSTSTRPGHIKDTVRRILNMSNSVEQIEQLRSYKLEKDGKRIPITDVDPEIITMLDTKEDALYNDEVETLNKEKQIRQTEANQAQLRYLQSKSEERGGFFTKEDVRESVDIADEIYGYGRNKDLDGELGLDTIDAKYKPIIEAEIEEMIENKTWGTSIMNEMGLPSDLKRKYLSMAQHLDNIRAKPEYKEARKAIKKRIEGALAMKAGVMNFSVEGDTQSDQINWYTNKYTNIYHRKYKDAVIAGDQNALELVGSQAASFTLDYFDEKKYPNNVINFRITDYDKQAEKNKLESKALFNKIHNWTKLNNIEKASPKNWVDTFGVETMHVATEELSTKGTSETFQRIGEQLGISQYEVQKKVAEVVKGIDEIEMPDTFKEFMSNFTPEESNMLQRSIHTSEKKEALLRSRLTNEPPAIRSSFQQTQQYSNPVQSQWEQLAVQAGFNPEEAVIMGQIVMAESDGDAAIDTVKSGLDPLKTNEYSIGGPQINVAVHQDKLAARGFTEEDMRDPLKSMIIAKDVYDQQGFNAWTTYGSGKYKNFGSIPAGALTYKDNKEVYKAAGNAFADAGFRVGEHSDFDEVDAVHSSTSYHYHDEAFDITHQTGDYDESIAKTGRLQQLISELDLFKEVIGPLSGDPDHATHLHLGGLKRPMTAEDIRLIKSMK